VEMLGFRSALELPTPASALSTALASRSRAVSVPPGPSLEASRPKRIAALSRFLAF
jgi:hypothetical protein